jgi:hypothetical protein
MSKNSPAPELYLVGLLTDTNCNHRKPTFNKSASQLIEFVGNRAEVLGILDTGHLGHALVNITDPSLVDELEEQDFVQRIAGSFKDISPLRDVRLQPVDNEQKFGVELTL